jgi:hypothetical protein
VAKNHYEINDRIIRSAKNRPCADCGNSYPYYVMDFDHVHGDKKFTIGDKRKGSTERIVAEIEKCEVVCANCHRIRTFGRRQSVR